LNKILLICYFLVVSLYGKDFYYNFIDEDKSQISEFRKNNILAGNHKLNVIKRLVREGQIDTAYKQIIRFKEKNKLKILHSRMTLLYADILYKKGNNKLAREAVEVLTKAIDNSKIQREDLLEAYKLLVVLNLRVNRPKDAKYYASSIGKIFDNPLSKVFGKISLAQIDMHRRQYKKAIGTLYDILVKTNNIDVATIVADELYDAYILSGEHQKAYDLAGKVLKKNIKFYANDSFLALKKVEKLLDANMPNFAIDILKMLLDNAVEPESINRFKFKLANTYMKVAGKDKKYMLLAKELYKDLIVQKDKTPYYKQVKVDMDEILMREGKLVLSEVAKKYYNSEVMEQKVLLQELLNASQRKDYASIQRMKSVYKRVSSTVAKRFGYESIDEVFDIINANMIKFYLENGKCVELSDVLHIVRDESLNVLIKNDTSRKQLFDCLTEIPDERSYTIAKNTFSASKDAQLYFDLEKIALLLDKTDDAYRFVQKIDMLNDTKIKEKEFLYRFLVYGKLDNEYSMEQFFRYTARHPEYIELNKENPLILDFYYQYYLYLQKQNKLKLARSILDELYNTQIKMNAFIYSPFVEMELAKEAKLDDENQKALELFELGIEHTRNIKENDLAHIYYEMAKIYEALNKKARYKNTIDKCKDLKQADNFYKKMCDKL
jgi:hypothetical protein